MEEERVFTRKTFMAEGARWPMNFEWLLTPMQCIALTEKISSPQPSRAQLLTVSRDTMF